MKLFGRKKDLVKSDPSDKPSVRYETVLFKNLEKEGFKYIKSKNKFSQDFQFGKRDISLSYNTSFGYISMVQYFVHIIFTDLEKLFKQIYPKYGWTNWTIHENLHWTESWLCDPNSGVYSDETINNLADEFLTQIKPHVDRIFNSANTYELLYQRYNLTSIDSFNNFPVPRLEKAIIIGLILVNKFEPNKYELKKRDYLKLLEKYKGNDIDEIRSEVIQGMNFIETKNIRLK